MNEWSTLADDKRYGGRKENEQSKGMGILHDDKLIFLKKNASS